MHFRHENDNILIKISLKFVSSANDPIDTLSLVLIAWHQTAIARTNDFITKYVHGLGTPQRREWILDELRNRFCTIFATDS